MEVGDAYRQVRAAVKDGRLVRAACEVCGDPLAEAHHDDYDAPLAVRWLCRRHHQEWHREHVPVNGGTSSRVVSTRLPAGYALLLAEMAEEAGMKPSELLRRVVAKWLDEGGPTRANPTPAVREAAVSVVAERKPKAETCRHGLYSCKACRFGRFA